MSSFEESEDDRSSSDHQINSRVKPMHANLSSHTSSLDDYSEESDNPFVVYFK